MSPPTAHDAHVMQCMEIWGGNREMETGIEAQGLDAWVYSRPFHAGAPGDGAPPARAGGDIYFLTSCATGRITRLLVADVSGHGEAVAEAARSLRRLLGEYANFVDQRRFVSAVNRRFGDIAGAEMGLFATAVVATYFSPTDELTVCSAGHPPALHLGRSSGRWRAIGIERAGDGGPSNLPLGVLDEAQYHQSTIGLGEGDAALFFTDALIEARAPDGRQLGVEGLASLAASAGRAPGEGFIGALLAGVDAYRRTGEVGAPAPGADGPGAFDDDVTVVLVQRNDRKPTPSVALGLAGGLRIARNVVSSLAHGLAPALPEVSVRALGGAFAPGLNRRRSRG